MDDLDQSRLDQTELDQAGLDQTELDQTGLDQTGLDQNGLDQTELDRTEPDQTGLDQTEPDQTEPDQTGLDQHALTIQSSFRGYRVRKKRKEDQGFSTLDEKDEAGVSSIQGESDPEEEIVDDSPERNEKVILIQSSYRGYRVRKAMKEKQNVEVNQESDFVEPSSNAPKVFDPNEEENFFHHHAVVIQSAYRGYVIRKDYKTRKNDPGEDIADGPIETSDFDLNEKAVIIQSSYRGYKARKKCREMKENQLNVPENEENEAKVPEPKYESIDLNENAVIIQSAYRGFTARKEYYDQRQAKAEENDVAANATVIQSAYRGFRSRKDYSTRVANQERENITVEDIEGHSVTIVEFPEDANIREEQIIIIQSAYRGYRIRKKAHLDKSADNVQAYAKGYNARKNFEEEKEKHTNAGAAASAFSTENFVKEESDDVIEEEEHDGNVRTKSTTPGKVSSLAEKRAPSSRHEETADFEKPKLGNRKFTEYIDHSSWVARHESKTSLVKQDSTVSSTVSTTLSRRRYRRKPLFMLRSATVTGDPSRGLSGLKTSKEVQVQDTDFSRHESKLDITRLESEASFSKVLEKRGIRHKGTPMPGKIEGWNESDVDSDTGEPKLPGKDQQGGTFMKYNRHQSDLNAVLEEPDENEESLVDESKGQDDVTKPPDNSPPMGAGYFNPFAFPPQPMNNTQPLTAPQFPPPMFYPYVTPYGTFFPHPIWPPFNPYPQNESPQPANQIEGGKKATNEKEESKKANQRNFVKDNKSIQKDVNKGSYKNLAVKREKLRESNEEHSCERENKGEEGKDDWIQTHTTVKDDNRVKVDINLNISGKQLASMLGYDDGAFSPRNAFQPPFFPGFYPPPPFVGNISSRTMPEILTNRKAEDNEDDGKTKKPLKSKLKKKKEETLKIDVENPGTKNLNKYPVIPPIKSENRVKDQPKKTQDAKIPFAGKRKVEYEPHTLEEYKKLDLNPKLPATLGPDWDRIEKVEAVKKRQAEYSEKLRKQHENLPTANKFPRKGYSREMMSKPEVHHEYMKTIPKPQTYQD